MTRDETLVRCTGWAWETEEPCPLKDKCLRHTMRLSLPEMISHWNMHAPGRWVEDVPGEPPDWVCEHFISNEHQYDE